MKRILAFVVTITVAAVTALAGVLDDAESLVYNGDYRAAMDMLAPLKKKSPRDGRTNYLYGLAARGLGNRVDAVTALRTAATRGYSDAYGVLTQMALELYDTEAANNYIADWRAALTKARKSEPAELSALESRSVLMANQLSRVENIPVIARYSVSRSDFDNALNGIGKADTPQGYMFIGPDSVPFFINNTNRDVFLTKNDDEGVSRLFTAGVLDDGTTEEGTELTEFIGDGDILAPFVMQDGETLYFAARRDDSLGGYDIYMTRRDGEGGFYQPSNIGMPYNSPDDDLLFVLDEANGLGWWASSRAVEPDSVNIYVFVPNKTRVNVDPDSENIADIARVTDTGLTLPADFDLAAATARIPCPETVNNAATQPLPDFELSLGDGRILHSFDDFADQQAADEMRDVLDLRDRLQDSETRLTEMRVAYAGGDTTLKSEIRALEIEVNKLRNDLRAATNRVIRLETSLR